MKHYARQPVAHPYAVLIGAWLGVAGVIGVLVYCVLGLIGVFD